MFSSEKESNSKIKVGGLTYIIRKLSPMLFLDKDYMYPISCFTELKETTINEKEIKILIESNKHIIKDVILKGVVKVKKLFSAGNIENYIDIIMEQPNIYIDLFNHIITNTLFLKKNSIQAI